MSQDRELLSSIRDEIQNGFDRTTATSNFVTPMSRISKERHDSTDQIPGSSAFHFSQFVDLVNAVIRGQPANPSRSEIVTRLDSAYALQAPRAQPKASGVTVASFDAVSALIEQLLRDTDHIALVGARGIGKTQLINRWLNHRTFSFLEKELEYTWFRVDMPKVYALKRDGSVDRRIATVENYYKVHAVYVVLFYAGFLEIPPYRINDIFSLVVQETQKDEYENFNFRSFVIAFTNLYEKMNDIYRGKSRSEHTVHSVFLKANRTLFEQALFAWEVISQKLSDLDCGILSIIDGIDNIAWSKNNEEYISACAEAKDFILHLRSTVNNDRAKVLIVSRPETIPEICVGTDLPGYNDGQLMAPGGIEFSVIQLMVPSIVEIIGKKCAAIKNEEAFKDQRNAAKQTINEYNQKNPSSPISFDQNVSELNRCVSTFVDTVSLEATKILNSAAAHGATFSHDVSRGGIIETVFDNDVRSLLDCAVRAFRAKGSAQQVRVRGFDESRRMLEYVVLGGRYFLDSRPLERRTRSTQIRRGDVFPNIFWFDQEQAATTQSIWHGLAGYRLLRLLDVRPLPARDALSFVQSCFGYDPQVLLTFLEDFIAFGLIDVNPYSNAKPKHSHSPLFANITTYVQISKKGQFLLDLALAYTDWLYFLALDTPIHRTSISEKRVRFYRFPDNPKISQYNYFDAFVPTLTTFVKHLDYYDKRQIARLKERLTIVSQDYGTLFDDWSVVPEFFALPTWFVPHVLSEIMSALRQREKTRYSDESSTFDDLARDIKGVFGVPLGPAGGRP
jgi:hypothetical protein